MSFAFERVAGPFQGPANGVVWDGRRIVFSLMEEQRLLAFDPGSGEVTELRKYTNRVNGLALGPDGTLYGCQEGGRRVIAFTADGRAVAADALLGGKYHNHPSDLVVDKAGRIWFSDPYSETLAFGPQMFPPLDHASVLRLHRDTVGSWALRRVTFDTAVPRAVLLSPDERTLYVAEGEPRPGFRRELRAYALADDGTAGPYAVLATFGADHRGQHRGIEGLCFDGAGNVVACGGWTKAGPGPAIYVFSPAHRLIAAHPFADETPNRCCFGGADGATLFVTTAEGSLYAVR